MKVPFFNSLRVRIIIAVVVLVSVPFAMLQMTNMFLIYNTLESKTEYTTVALAHSIATNVEEFMQGVYDSSALLARNDLIVSGHKDGQVHLEDAIKLMPYFQLIYVQGTDGQQTLRSSGKLANRSDRWWFKRMMARPSPFVSEAYVSVNNNELVTSVFWPMYQGQKLTGVLGADFSLETIQEAVGQYWNDQISFIVMDSQGSVLAGTDYKPGEYINYIDYTKRTVVMDENNHFKLDSSGQIITKTENIDVSDSMKRIISGALQSKTESFKFKDSNNNIVVCAYQPIKLPGESTPWSVIVFQRQTNVISLFLLVGMFMLLVIGSIFITYNLINRSVLNPVLTIQQYMAKIADGKLDVRIDASMNNEIGQLAANINEMAASLKQQQQKIDEDEKMVSLGNLVAGVAHEVNTPLGIGVTTASYMAKINNEYRNALNEGKFSKQDLLEYMESMDEGLHLLQYNLGQGAKIIRSFKQVAVDQTLENQEEFNVLQYINSIVVSLTHEYKRFNPSFNINCDAGLTIISYPGVLAQILTNFIMNSVTHAFNDTEQGLIDIAAYKEEAMFVLSYSDNGSGISEENLPKIFTPFFTTRKGMGGSGLGLSIVSNLVKNKLNGSITVESRISQGTTFIIKYPV